MVAVERAHNPEYQSPVRITRVIPVAPISVAEFQKRIYIAKKSRVGVDDIPFTEVIFLQKSDASIPSAGLVMPIGGEMGPGETTYNAGIRELVEESTLIPLSTKWAIPRTDTTYFSFTIPGYPRQRNLSIITVPVRSSSFSSHTPREGSNGDEDKIQRLITIPSSELANVLKTGIIQENGNTLHLAGNFTYQETDDIILTNDQRVTQHKMLDNTLQQVAAFESELKETMLWEINENRRKKGRSAAKSLSACRSSELTQAFIATQMDIDYYGNRTTGKEALLKTANYVSGAPARYATELLRRDLPEEVQRRLTYFGPSFLDGARSILKSIDVQIEQNRRDPEEVLQALRQNWSKIVTLPSSTIARLLQSANKAMISKLSSEYAMYPHNITTALNAVVTFHTFFTDSLRNHPDFNSSIFQEYQSRSELTSNPLLFTIAALALGFDPDRKILSQKRTPEEYNRRLPFEAMKILSLFGIAIDNTQDILANADNQVLQRTINRMFQESPIPEMFNLGNGKYHNILHRATIAKVNGKPILIEYDERPKKSMHSALRKTIQDPNLDDIYTVNFILTEGNFTENQTINDRLSLADNFRELLLSHITEDLQQDPDMQWTVSIKPGTHKRAALDLASAIALDPTQSITAQAQGKRAGSEGDRILREKFILVLTGTTPEGNQVEEKIEVSIYPFESSTNPDVTVLSERGFWGFQEKIIDDSNGVYQAMRLVLRDQRYLEEESLFEQFYPAHIYDVVSTRFTPQHVRSRKNRAV